MLFRSDESTPQANLTALLLPASDVPPAPTADAKEQSSALFIALSEPDAGVQSTGKGLRSGLEM